MQKKKVLLLLSNGFEVFEASVFTDVIGWNMVDGDGTTELFSCGFNKEVKSAFNQCWLMDYLIDEINVDDFDALAIPGGFEIYGFYEDLYNPKFSALIQEFRKQGKFIASICAGAMALGKSGIIEGKKATTYPTRQEQLKEFNVDVQNTPILIEDGIVTSWNPSTAAEVAFILLENLTNKKNTDHIREIMGFTKN